MTPPVKPRSTRSYVSTTRAEQAAATRRRVLDAARTLFTTHGYAAVGMAQLAAAAGVAVDTVYASVGRKPEVLRALVESALSGTDDAIPAEQREQVRRVRAARSARDMISLYAAAVTAVGERMAPISSALREAAVSDPECAALHRQISERRAANMRLFAADLRATGELRPDLSDDEVADIVWSMNAAEYRALLVDARGWSSERFGAWLQDAWCRTLLAPPR